MSACSSLTPDSSENPCAMALEESGTEKTQSAPGAGCSRASSCPSARRTRSTERWNTVLSGREKYTSSNTQRRRGCAARDRKSTRLNSSHGYISYAVFCLKKKKNNNNKYDHHHHRYQLKHD